MIRMWSMIERAARSLLRNGHPADGAHVDEEILDRLAHEMRAREPDDRLVERDVGVGVLVDVLGRRRVAEFVEHGAQRRDVRVRRVQRREPRGHALERRPHLDHLDDLLLRLAHDEAAAARHRAQESFLLEQRHRLADRRARDAERLAQLALVQADLVAMRIDVRVHDRLLQRRVRLVAQARVGRDRLQRQRGLGVGARVDMPCYPCFQCLVYHMPEFEKLQTEAEPKLLHEDGGTMDLATKPGTATPPPATRRDSQRWRRSIANRRRSTAFSSSSMP